MPEISRFLGIIITMNYADHPPPHFHVRYGEYKAIVSIRPLAVIEGKLPPRVQGLIIEWAALCQDELLENWGRAQRRISLRKIAPLE
jgi:hypothetical protein